VQQKALTAKLTWRNTTPRRRSTGQILERYLKFAKEKCRGFDGRARPMLARQMLGGLGSSRAKKIVRTIAVADCKTQDKDCWPGKSRAGPAPRQALSAGVSEEGRRRFQDRQGSGDRPRTNQDYAALTQVKDALFDLTSSRRPHRDGHRADDLDGKQFKLSDYAESGGDRFLGNW